jgi:hypothetical protein
MEKKAIKIDPTLFGYGGTNKGKSKTKKEKIKKDMLVNVNPKNVKELLLQKLKDYKKRKTSKNVTPQVINENRNKNINPDFLEKIKKRKQRIENSVMINNNASFDNFVPDQNNVTRHIISENQLHSNQPNYNTTPTIQQPQPHMLTSKPEYGILKNGSLPTYRSMLRNRQQNRTMKNVINHFNLPPKQEKIELQIERKLKVGLNKTKKKVGIFIKNSKLRKDIENNKLLMKKTHIKTVKNYLKKNNLIKHGSNAPSELLRYMYENSQLLGDVNNNNSKNALHNYMNDEE